MNGENQIIVLLGYSGHGIVVADCAISSGMKVKYYAEKNALKANPFELAYLGFEAEDSFGGWKHQYGFILGIGDNGIRLKLTRQIEHKGEQLLNVIHPASEISKSVSLGKGVFISKNVSVNPMVSVGDCCILNTGCIVEHECKVGEATHIGPGAVLAGNVNVGAMSFIGANAVIKQGVQIGNNVIVGAGAVVIRDIANNETWAGNPAKRIR